MDRLHDTLKDLGSALHTKAGTVSDKDIKAAEKQLDIEFGSEMKEFLLKYGSISYKSVELYGLGFTDDYYLNIVAATKELREMGLPKEYLPIYNIGDGYYAVVSESDEVYEWAYHEDKIDRKIAKSLSDFIVRLIKAAN
ncbi:MAG: SMI1/KNR4 family protein [Candidatus Cloacimonadaceae bacterium]|jgi:hypothetical protein